MSGDRSPGYCYSNQDAVVYGAWSSTQRASRGNGSTKFIQGVCKDSNNNTVSGAIVQGFITATDIYVGETTCDSNGNYELGTVYPATSHYLVAYRAGSPDIAGTTVNTLTPTNRDGT
jgi:protocatechuate 3,4-dioxygenase beta subunit